MFRKETVVHVAWFALASLAVCLFVFRSSLWGGTLLAPLDIAPACFSHYRFVDPGNTGVVESNAQFDQVVYDLPLQYGIYHAYRRGEIPWWDPFGFTGRPLLADGHINGTDPIRLIAYAFLPFVLAYNWTLIGHSLLSGLSMFCLLWTWRFRAWICGLLALTFQFAGSQTFFFGFPWLHGSLLYYPVLWLAWDAAFHSGRRVWWGVASLAIAAIFYSGNLQSHSYLVLFSGAFAVGYAGVSWTLWRRLLPMLVVCGLLGACLAAPVLLNQLEFFLAGTRAVKPAVSGRVYLVGLATLTSIFPWMLGDFRTLDVRSALFQSIGFGQNYGLGFHTYIGSAGLILAGLGVWLRGRNELEERRRRTAAVLTIGFLVIISTPLIAVFYTRMAGLYVLAAVLLAAVGLENLASSHAVWKRLGWTVAAAAIAIAIAINVGALILFPRVAAKVRQITQQRDSQIPPGAVFKMPSGYREFQISNLPNEVSFKNPETLFAFTSLILLGAALVWPDVRARRWVLPLLVAVNVIPLTLFAARFVPRQPIVMWQRLLAGGPLQQEAVQLLGPTHLRLLETAKLRNDYLFPDAMEHLYGIQTVHGYSALVPQSIHSLDLAKEPQFRNQIADYRFTDGNLERSTSPGSARFRWLTPSERTVQIDKASLNQMLLRISPGPEGTLVWTDTHYPGWTASIDGKPVPVLPEPPCFNRIQVPSNGSVLLLRYRPTYLSVGLALSVIGIGGIVLSARGVQRPALPQVSVNRSELSAVTSSHARRD